MQPAGSGGALSGAALSGVVAAIVPLPPHAIIPRTASVTTIRTPAF